jgi:hypothetical protein
MDHANSLCSRWRFTENHIGTTQKETKFCFFFSHNKKKVKLPRASRVKFKAVRSYYKGSKDVLEQELSLRYSTLTQGTTICVSDGKDLVEMEIVELEPARCCYILNSQVNVEFEASTEAAQDDNKVCCFVTCCFVL